MHTERHHSKRRRNIANIPQIITAVAARRDSKIRKTLESYRRKSSAIWRCSAGFCILLTPFLAATARAQTAKAPADAVATDAPAASGASGAPALPAAAPAAESAPFAALGAPLRKLYDAGIQVHSTFYDDLQGNPIGGLRQGTDNAGTGTIGLNADLDRVAGVKGGKFHLLFTYEFGDSTQANIGNFVKTQGWYFPFQKFQLAELSYEQNLFDGALNLYGGRISAVGSFARPTYGCAFVSGSQCPYVLPLFTGGLSGFPYSTWGGRIRVKPSTHTYVQTGVFSVDPDRKNVHGFDPGLTTATGVAVPLEVGYESDFSNDRYPRHYKLGVWYNNAPSIDPLLNAAHQSRALFGGAPLTNNFDRGGYYALFDQVIFRPDNSHRALAVFGSLSSPFDRREILSAQNTLGLYYTGPFASRPRDAAGLMVTQLVFTRAEAQFMNQLLAKNGSSTFVNRHQYDIEANYAFHVLPGVTVTPNVEYIVHPDITQRPDARFAPRNALVLGIHLTLGITDLLGVPSALPAHY